MNILKLSKINLININSILIIFFIFYIYCSSWGYGNDNDTYGLISSGQNLINNFQYKPSRFQGNLVPEIIIGFASKYGGFLLSNSISVLLSIFSLHYLYKLILLITTNYNSLFIITLIGLNPFFIIAATSTMDYIYGIFFLIIGFYFAINKKFLISSIILSLALSSRLSNLFIVIFFYLSLFLNINYYDRRKLFFTGLLNLFFTLILYLPVFFYSSMTFSFLSYAIGNWNFQQYLIRFIYKNVAIFGLIMFGFIYYRTLFFFKSIIHSNNNKILIFITILYLIQEILFFKVPLEISYLIPNFILLVILYTLLEKNISFKYFLLFLSIFNLFINIDFLKIKHDLGVTEAQSASIGLYFKKGVLIEDLTSRSKSQIYYQKSENN